MSLFAHHPHERIKFMVRVEPYTRPAISPIQKNTNTPFKQYKEDNLAQDIYVSAKRCTVVGKIVRKLGKNSFLLSTTHQGIYEQYNVLTIGSATELLEIIPSGQTVRLKARAYQYNRKIEISAIGISTVDSKSSHIPPPNF